MFGKLRSVCLSVDSSYACIFDLFNILFIRYIYFIDIVDISIILFVFSVVSFFAWTNTVYTLCSFRLKLILVSVYVHP